MRTPLIILTLIAGITTAGWIITLSKQMKVAPPAPKCVTVKIDTIYNMVTDIRWERNDNLPLVAVDECPVSQEVVIMKYWSPIENHSEITNFK